MLDYRIFYAIGDGAYQVLATGLISLAYTAKSLETGTTYRFKVQARNFEGFSDYSQEVTILAA